MKELLDKATELRNTYEIVGRAHYLTADHKRAMNRYFGIPVIVITAVVGTSIFGTLNDSPEPVWRIVAGLVTLTGTILSSLQTLLGFAQDAEKHKSAGETYRAVARGFEMFLLKYAKAPADHHDAAFSDLNKLVNNLNDLPKEFPVLPDRYYDRARQEQSTRLVRDGKH